ncbi:MAG: UvrB/UvrC motif-containing protein [Eubacteriales bacterium]|nr:UvrB/UvrC motif-containing protein [Eubacteriales bacterium]
MKCQICNQRNAEIIVAMNAGEEEKNIYVCRHCMQNMGLDFGKMLGKSLLDSMMNIVKNANVSCPHCGLTLQEYMETKEYRCEHCEESFANAWVHTAKMDKQMLSGERTEQDNSNKNKIHTFFEAKSPKKTKFQTLVQTKKMLAQAIELEDYVKAARLRKQLLKLEKLK